MRWTLNGTPIADFRGLSKERIDRLKHVGTFYGCEVFTTPDCPMGTLELWDNGQRVAVIEGTA